MSNPGIKFLEKPEHLKTKQLHGYWESKRSGQAVPDRQAIVPADIPHLLPNLWVCEAVDEARNFKFRLFGTELVQVLGEERTGKLISDIGDTPDTADPDQVRQAWLDILQLTFRTAKPFFMEIPLSASGRSYLIAHMVTLPLTDGERGLSRILGGIFFESTSPETA